jgi:hypothetical protein
MPFGKFGTTLPVFMGSDLGDKEDVKEKAAEIQQSNAGKMPASDVDPFDVSKAGAPWQEGVAAIGDQDEDAAGVRQNAVDRQARDMPMLDGPTQTGTVDGGFASEPYGGWGMVGKFQRANKELGDATMAEGRLKSAQALDEANLREQENARRVKEVYDETVRRNAEQRQAQDRLVMLQKQSDELARTKIDQGRVFHSPAGVLGAIAATFMPLFSKDPEAGIRVINQSIARDVDVQQMNMQNKRDSLNADRGLYRDYLELTRDDQAARALTEAKMKDIAANKILEVAARYQSPLVMEQAKAKSALLKRDSTLATMDIFKKMWNEPKLMNHALRAFFGPNYFQRLDGIGSEQRGEETDLELGDVGITNGPTDEDPNAWNTGKGGEVYRSDVDYIKGPDDDERPMDIGGSNSQVFARQETVTNDPQVKGVKLPAQTKNVIDAMDNMKRKDPAYKKYAEVYANPAAARELDDYKEQFLVSKYRQYGGNVTALKKGAVNQAIMRKAYGDWLKELDEAQKPGGGTAKIAEAQKDYAELENAIGYMQKRMDTIAANGEAAQVISKINLASPSWRQDYKSIKDHFGLSDEQDKAMEDLYRSYGFLRGVKGKQLFGAISASDRDLLDRIASEKVSFGQMRETVRILSSSTKAALRNQNKTGGRLAEIMWRAQHKSVAGEIPSDGIKEHDRNNSPAARGIINRDIKARPTVISDKE